MRYKHIATIGAILITIFVLLAALMYYFNQDSCPKGTFPCSNGTECLPQPKWCDGEVDCKDGDDESGKCIDLFGGWKWYARKLITQNRMPRPHCRPVTKNDPGYFESCSYQNCAIECNEFPEPEFPLYFPENAALIVIENSSIPVLNVTSFQRYIYLRELYLNNNSIQSLEPYVFSKQKALTELKLSRNRIQEIRKGHLVGLISLETLVLDNNNIHSFDLSDLENSSALLLLDLTRNLLRVTNFYLPYLPALDELNLDENQLDCITSDMFSQLPALSSLTLENNRIKTISPNAFNNLVNLLDLNLMHNQIDTVAETLFISTVNLSKLQIGHNDGLRQENLLPALLPLKNSINSLNIEEVDMDDVEKDFFNTFTELEFLYFKRFHYCTAYAPNVQKCKPPSDGKAGTIQLQNWLFTPSNFFYFYFLILFILFYPYVLFKTSLYIGLSFQYFNCHPSVSLS